MQVQRNRREQAPPGLSRLTRHGSRAVVAGVAAFAVAGAGVAYASTVVFGQNKVGTEYPNGLQVSDDQLVQPVGDRLLTELGKFMASSVSRDGRFLAASSADKSVALQIFDLQSYKLVYTVGRAATVDQKLTDGSVGQGAPTWSPDGKVLWLPQKDALTRFEVNADGTLGTGTQVPLAKVAAAPAPTGTDRATTLSALPAAGVYSADGATLYMPLNGQNTVVALDPVTGAVRRSWAVGIAPRELALAGSKLYVSNEGGRPARPGEPTINSYGTDVPADTFLGTSTTGTLSVIDTTAAAAPSTPPATGTATATVTTAAAETSTVRSIDVGLHPTALYRSGTALFVANTNSDTVSVVDTTKDQVVQTISTRPWPAAKVGYQPTGITMTRDRHLLVTLGRANAVAVYRYNGTPKEPVDDVGLLPTDYYPQDIATVGDRVVVTNTRGIDARGLELTFKKGPGTTPATGHGTHSTTASLTRFTLPNDRQVKRATATVFEQNGWSRGDVKQGRGNRVRAVAVPKRLGDPSTIQHVFLLVKENRTYDQVFGDLPQGDGDPALTQFGAKVTPNQHALAQQFGLYDNTYDPGTNSAEGHNWVMQGDNPEYTESSAGEYVRSYDTEDDVLGHQRSGFLWTAVESAGRTARNFGEFLQFENKPKGATWQQYYCATKSVENGGDPSQLTDPSIRTDNHSPIPSLDAITNHDYPKFDTDIPDTYRYQIWKDDFEKRGPAALNMFWLSSDHTGGAPTPEAQVADNDLAVGKIVDTISHSKYWKSSAIFVLEDDSQDGADHVDGHRAPVQIISPWAQRGAVDSTYYSQITMVRTIEQILGAQPLNQKLAAATPMYSAFTDKADTTPFTVLPNQVPLTEGVTPAPECGPDLLGTTGVAAQNLKAQVAAKVAVPTAQKAVAAQWAAWAKQQRFTGSKAVPDAANPEQMNRYTWYRTHQWKTPYPGDTTVYAPSQVPAGYVPSADAD